MARAKSILNQKSPEDIEKNFLEENPEGFKPTTETEKELMGVQITRKMPKMRKVIFLNGRDPGVALHFHYISKTHPMKHYTLFHGLEHELSEEIIEHLESCREPEYGYRKGMGGTPESYVKNYKYIFQCRNPSSRQFQAA